MPLVSRSRTFAGVAIATVLSVSACAASPSSSGPTGTRDATAPASPPAAAPTLSATPSPPPVEATATPTPGPASATPAAPATAAPGSEPPAPAGPPTAPAGVALQVERGIAGEDGLLMTRYTVTWASPLDPDTTIRVIGVTSCPVPPPEAGERPCVTDATPLPARIRLPIARGSASSGSASWLWPEQDVDGPVLAVVDGVSYVAYVVRAVNAAGRSPFVVVESTVTCPDNCMR